MKHHHPYCKDVDCKVCFQDAMALQKVLLLGTGDAKVDHLRIYHKWLADNKIPNETEWGWPTPEAYDDSNINNYINWYKEKENK